MVFDLGGALVMAREWAKTAVPKRVSAHDNPDRPRWRRWLVCRCCSTSRHYARLAWRASSVARKTGAMVRVLSFDLRPIETSIQPRLGIIALLDTQPGTETTAAAVSRLPDIVIDHHPPRALSAEVPWRDIRPEFGASARLSGATAKSGIERPPTWPPRFCTVSRPRPATPGRECGTTRAPSHLELSAQADHQAVFDHQSKLSCEHFVAMDRACRRPSGESCSRSTWAPCSIPTSPRRDC